MSHLPGFNLLHHTALSEPPRPLNIVPRQTGVKPQRLRTWDLPSMFHCSIIGTCLTAAELRQLVAKIDDTDARTASDHMLHGRGVRIAGQRDVTGKLLNKALDRRHEAPIKRFSKASDVKTLRRLWQESFDLGEISGAYWAILSHPLTDAELRRDVFGEVHMLSHLVGSASRLDIARLTALQKQIEEKDEKLARQEQRLAASAAEQTRLQRRIEELEERLVRAETARPSEFSETERRNAEAALIARLDKERSRADTIADRLKGAETRARQAEERAERISARAVSLEQENDLLEAILLGDEEGSAEFGPTYQGGAILYVGGRRSLFDKLKALAAERGITLLLHDGGLEDNTTLLPALVGQAQAVIFPVDHISHTAAGLIKRICRDSRKPFVPMRSAGLASFVATITAPAFCEAAS